MASNRSQLMSAIRDGIVKGRGDLPEEVRESIFREAMGIVTGNPGERTALPEPLHSFVEKVAGSSYKVTDDDFAALKSAGHSEDAIFLAVAVCAVGAGLARLDIGLAALDAET